jgi:hypothetical protein
MSVGVDLELQPQTPGYLHLGRQAQETVGFEALHPPEIDGVPDAQIDRIASAAAKSHATPEGVEQAARLPEPVPGIPAVLSPDALDRLKHLLERTADGNRAGGNLASTEANPAPPERLLDGQRV